MSWVWITEQKWVCTKGFFDIWPTMTRFCTGDTGIKSGIRLNKRELKKLKKSYQKAEKSHDAEGCLFLNERIDAISKEIELAQQYIKANRKDK